MRRFALVLACGAVITAIAVIGLGGAPLASGPTAPASEVQVVPFAKGHIVAAGKPFQLQHAYDLSPLFGRGIEGQGQTIVLVDAFARRPAARETQGQSHARHDYQDTNRAAAGGSESGDPWCRSIPPAHHRVGPSQMRQSSVSVINLNEAD
jgi:hypothetical protein